MGGTYSVTARSFSSPVEAAQFALSHSCLAINGEFVFPVYTPQCEPLRPPRFEVYEVLPAAPDTLNNIEQVMDGLVFAPTIPGFDRYCSAEYFAGVLEVATSVLTLIRTGAWPTGPLLAEVDSAAPSAAVAGEAEPLVESGRSLPVASREV